MVVPPGAAGARRLVRAKAQFSPTAPAPLPAGSLSGWSFGNAPGEVPPRFHTSGVAQTPDGTRVDAAAAARRAVCPVPDVEILVRLGVSEVEVEGVDRVRRHGDTVIAEQSLVGPVRVSLVGDADREVSGYGLVVS